MENRAEHLLESYFANALTAAEATELKILADTDPGVAAELAFQQRVAATLQSRSLAEGIQNSAWRSAAQKPFSGAIKVTMWPRYFYAAAAAITLLIAAYLWLQPPSLPTLVADNATKFPNNLPYKNMGGESMGYSPEAISALSLYDQDKFSEAAKALEPIVAANPDRMDYRFYWGVSLVKDKQYAVAASALLPVVQSPDERKNPARFFLGLACAGTGDKDCARLNLQAYVDSPDGDPKRKKQAKVVLDAL